MAWVQTNSGNLITGLTLSISPSGFAGTVNLNSFTQLRSFVATGLGLEGMNISGIASSSSVMTNFDVRNNNMTGSLPRITGNISTNSTIRNYYCMSNLFTGNVPRLSAFPNMQNFRCNNNNLNGIIEWTGTNVNNSSLTYFDCAYNNLYGQLPVNLQKYTSMINFFVNDNQFIGPIPNFPTGNGATVPSLSTIYLHKNQLSGPITNLDKLVKLTQFQCFANFSIGGAIPNISFNTGLRQFQCYQNQLTGAIPVLTGNKALNIFRCHYNQLNGSIPNLIFNTGMTDFYCNSNIDITGFAGTGMPPSLKNFQADTCSLTQDTVDRILRAFVDAGASSGNLTLGGGNNSAPSSAGYNDKNTLISRYWSVSTK